MHKHVYASGLAAVPWRCTSSACLYWIGAWPRPPRLTDQDTSLRDVAQPSIKRIQAMILTSRSKLRRHFRGSRRSGGRCWFRPDVLVSHARRLSPIDSV